MIDYLSPMNLKNIIEWKKYATRATMNNLLGEKTSVFFFH